jgi:hypothetical protein
MFRRLTVTSRRPVSFLLTSKEPKNRRTGSHQIVDEKTTGIKRMKAAL